MTENQDKCDTAVTSSTSLFLQKHHDRSGPVFTKTFILTLGVLLNRTINFYVGVIS